MSSKINNTKQLEDLQSDYFVRMMLPDAEVKVVPYVEEEKKELVNILETVKDIYTYNFVVVGAGTLWYIDLVYKKIRKYIAIEPLANIFIAKQFKFILNQISDIKIIEKEFGDFDVSFLDNHNSIFVFHFNILSYINDPINKINKYLKEGDVLYISSWNNTEYAKKVRKDYFDFINIGIGEDEFKIDPDSNVGLCNLDNFDFNLLRFYKMHKRIKSNITDVLIIYT